MAKRRYPTKSGNPAKRAEALRQAEKLAASKPKNTEPSFQESEDSPSGYVVPVRREPEPSVEEPPIPTVMPFSQKIAIFLVFVLSAAGAFFGATHLGGSSTAAWAWAAAGGFVGLMLFTFAVNFWVSRKHDSLREQFKKENLRIVIILAIMAVVVSLFGAGLLSRPSDPNESNPFDQGYIQTDEVPENQDSEPVAPAETD